MHLVTYSNHDTVLFLLIVPIKGRLVRDGIHCVFIYQRLHDFVTFLEYLGNLVHFSIYEGWNFPFIVRGHFKHTVERFDIETLFIIIKGT